MAEVAVLGAGLKDLRLINALAENRGMSLPTTRAVAREVDAACASRS